MEIKLYNRPAASRDPEWPKAAGGRILYSRLSAEQAAVLLEHSYELFVKFVDSVGMKMLTVPNTDQERQEALNSIQAYAYGCGLCEAMRPRTDALRAQLALAVPELVFARFDRIQPNEFLASLEPSALERWHDICRRRATGSGTEIVRSFEVALDMVKERMKAEAPIHVSLDAFFEGEPLIPPSTSSSRPAGRSSQRK
ncbi:hypothetical protein [Methylobacterium oxalidis]|uniref:Uncharacterized protein n=1 Tax=Methylobacterium oxalidis TaxID=944322 RepID=A0A512J1L6_9HYPH|nr:hypothetical protein [Methylobacterium oxalidis]GEP03856.1 hypothetical protein MOX02_18940 [Methylobacterium oxalidis]GJE31270.1 hypothetical protein LDDCCGHA_1447 [Methylobacterium oxalidis]GLS65286.1 hypothetical protein GCM10007888_36680 [Methylobacterium oxalidis]